MIGQEECDLSLTDLEDHESADAFFAQELNQLTLKEREEINEEIHGIRQHHYPKETPELLRDSLREFQIALNSLPPNQAYEKAKDFPESYINTDDFQLIFLRCEYFVALKAAIRMLKYVSLIYKSFGEKVLEREIDLDDFDGKAMKFLKTGYHQILPGRDRFGRRIAGNFIFDIDPTEPKENRVRNIEMGREIHSSHFLFIKPNTAFSIFFSKTLPTDTIGSVLHHKNDETRYQLSATWICRGGLDAQFRIRRFESTDVGA